MKLDFEKMDGLVPAVVQDATSGRVLMVAFMNEKAWHNTIETGLVTFYSRTRDKLWVKGESSGHVLKVREIFTDCDMDTVVVKVDAVGPGVCHEGYESCFYRRLAGEDWTIDDSPTFDKDSVYGGVK